MSVCAGFASSLVKVGGGLKFSWWGERLRFESFDLDRLENEFGEMSISFSDGPALAAPRAPAGCALACLLESPDEAPADDFPVVPVPAPLLLALESSLELGFAPRIPAPARLLSGHSRSRFKSAFSEASDASAPRWVR